MTCWCLCLVDLRPGPLDWPKEEFGTWLEEEVRSGHCSSGQLYSRDAFLVDCIDNHEPLQPSGRQNRRSFGDRIEKGQLIDLLCGHLRCGRSVF